MSMRAVAISLKIPDNAAYTTLVALRRLGIAVERLERSELRFFDSDADTAMLIARVTSDETIFNPNKHRVSVLDTTAPRAGEVWIETLDASIGSALIAWRLFDEAGEPVPPTVVTAAAERLLCNPAIERPRFAQTSPG